MGTGVETSFSRVVDIINHAIGTNITAINVDNPIKNYVYRIKADISRITSELGYQPRFKDLEGGIRSLTRHCNIE